MAFNIQYGPISTAMGLAQQAGNAEGRRADFSDDMNLLNYAQRAQQMAQQQRATEISQSLQGQGLGLEAQRNQSSSDLAKAQLAATTGYRNASLDSQNDYRQGRNDIGRQNADTKAQQVANQGENWQNRADISQQNADTNAAYKGAVVPVMQQNADTRTQGMANQNTNAQANTAVHQQDADTKALNDEAGHLQQFASNHDRNFGNPQDPDYVAVKQRMAQIQQQLATRDTNLLGKPVKVQAPAAPQQQARQQAPGATPATAVQVKGDQDFAQLPHGAYFTGPDGVLRQKP